MTIFSLEDVNKLLSKAIRKIRDEKLSFTEDDIYIILGKEEIEQVKHWAYSVLYVKNSTNHYNINGTGQGLDIFRNFNINLIESSEESQRDVCFMVR